MDPAAACAMHGCLSCSANGISGEYLCAEGLLLQALLPLARQHLLQMKHPLFMAVSLALLAALEPPMWHLWTVLNTANANFYYAITLLWGSWQVSCARIFGLKACWRSSSISMCVAAVQKHEFGDAHAVKLRSSYKHMAQRGLMLHHDSRWRCR